MRDNLSFYEPSLPTAPLSIISIPTDLGSDARGLGATPEYLRARGLYRMLEGLGTEIASEVTIPCPQPPLPGPGVLKNLDEVAAVADATAQAIEAAAGRGDTVLSIGGDHSASIGTLRGAAQAHPSLGIIWIDAHPDVHTPETTVTHNLHNMPAALAMGVGHPALLAERAPIAPQNFLFLGAKDFDEAEIEFLRRHSPPVFTMLDVLKGLGPLFAAIYSLSQRVERVWISMDMDAIEKSAAPGVAMPNEGGLTAREMVALAHYIGQTTKVAGIDLVEMLPSNDHEGRTAGLALEITARLMGGEYSWYKEYMSHYENERSGAII